MFEINEEDALVLMRLLSRLTEYNDVRDWLCMGGAEKIKNLSIALNSTLVDTHDDHWVKPCRSNAR